MCVWTVYFAPFPRYRGFIVNVDVLTDKFIIMMPTTKIVAARAFYETCPWKMIVVVTCYYVRIVCCVEQFIWLAVTLTECWRCVLSCVQDYVARVKRETPVMMTVLLVGAVIIVMLALSFCYYTRRASHRQQQQQQSPTLSSLSPDALGITNGTLTE